VQPSSDNLVQNAALQYGVARLSHKQKFELRDLTMSKQLALSATLSVLAMIGLALGAPAIADHAGSNHAANGAAITTAAPFALAN